MDQNGEHVVQELIDKQEKDMETSPNTLVNNLATDIDSMFLTSELYETEKPNDRQHSHDCLTHHKDNSYL